MGCEFMGGRKQGSADLNLNAPEIRELLADFPQHRALIISIFDSVRNFSPEASYDRWYRLIRDELPRLPIRTQPLPSVEAPGDLNTLLDTLLSGHLCIGRMRKGEMMYILGVVFRDFGLPNVFQISPENFMDFAKELTLRMKSHYRSFEYAFMSAMLLFAMLKSSARIESHLQPTDRLVLLLAVLGAAYDHPMMSSEMMVRSRHTLAFTYLGAGTVEKHCANEYIAYLQQFSLLNHLDTSVTLDILKQIKRLIESLAPEKQISKLQKWEKYKLEADSADKQRSFLCLLTSASCSWPYLSCEDCKPALQKQLTVEFDKISKSSAQKGFPLPANEQNNYTLSALLSLQTPIWRETVSLLDVSRLKAKVETALGTN